MSKNNSLETIDKTNLSEQTKFRLDEISKIENYFIEEINQRKSCSQKLNKYVTTFDYIDKIFNCFKCKDWRSINYFIYKCYWSTSWNRKCKFYFNFFFNNWNGKKIIEYNEKKRKKKHDKILMLAKSKLNRVDTLISQALIDMDISHEEFITILKEKDRYQMVKDNLKNKNGESYEIMRLNSVKSKI